MKDFRRYGKEPYDVSVVHGGPGAPGDAAPLARELSGHHGVLEPLLSSESIHEQVEELRSLFIKNSDQPLYLIGHSYGAWLSLIFTSLHPELVKKLIVIASGPFESRYASSILETRLERLDDEDKVEFYDLIETLSDASNVKRDIPNMMDRIMSKTDSFDPIDHKDEVIEFQPDVYKKVWKEALELRKNEELLEYVEKIECPVLAIHGVYDPHPYKGVKDPLSKRLDDFKFILLKKCGHYPWYERKAKEKFFKILKEAIG